MLDLNQARQLEGLKYGEALDAVAREFDRRAAEIDRDVDQRSGAWHAARGKLRFDRIEVGVNEALRIRKDLVSQCPELASPYELRKLEERLVRTIDGQFQRALNSFQLPGPRRLASVITGAHDRRRSLKDRLSRSIQILGLEASSAAPKHLFSAVEKLPTMGCHNPANIVRVFISYSWDSENHKADVLGLATRLRNSGVLVVFDEWDLLLGHDRHHFMEKSVYESDYVLIICTPQYAQKANERQGGVGYEACMITPELAGRADQTKFIPVLWCGTWETSLPRWLKSRRGVDLSGSPYSETAYEELQRHVRGAQVERPPSQAKPSVLGQEAEASRGEPEAGHDEVPPTEPILSTAGLGSLRVGGGLLAQTVAVDNVQDATENRAENARTRLDYHHPALGGRVADPGAWLLREGSDLTLLAATVDIPNEARFNAVYLFQDEASDWCFPSLVGAALVPGAKVEVGRWRVVISVRADNCRFLRFGVAFRISADGRLADQCLVAEKCKLPEWLLGKGSGMEVTGVVRTQLSYRAEFLVFDLANDCALDRRGNGAPAVVMPRPGRPKPMTNGQVDDEIVEELLSKDLISTDCKLTRQGENYYECFLKPLS